MDEEMGTIERPQQQSMYVAPDKDITMKLALYYDFMLYKRALKPFNNLAISVSFYYDKIANKNFMYNFNKIIASKIYDINNKSLEELYTKYFKNNNSVIIKIKKLNK